MVSAFRDSQRSMRSSGPMTLPARERRLQADHIMRMGSIGVTEKSEWLEHRNPFAIAEFIGLRNEARPGPRVVMCSSPQTFVRGEPAGIPAGSPGS